MDDVVVLPAGMLDAVSSSPNTELAKPSPEADELVAICQICMDIVPQRTLVTQLCGPACLAEVCQPCLVQHLIATVYTFYPGVLPKVRCPVCLTLLNKGQWEKFVAPAPAPVQDPAPEPEPTPETAQAPAATETEPVATETEPAATPSDESATETAVDAEQPEVAAPIDEQTTQQSDTTAAEVAVAMAASPAPAQDGDALNTDTAGDSEVTPVEVPAPSTNEAEQPAQEIEASSNAEVSPSARTQDAPNTDEAQDAQATEATNPPLTTEEAEQTGQPEEAQQSATEEAPAAAPQPQPQPVDDNSHVLEKYNVLCRQSCGFQAPCCHEVEYTMLPAASESDAAQDFVIPVKRGLEVGVPTFLEQCRAFCLHLEDASALYERMEGIFGDDTEQVLWQLLPRIADEERRATLLLHHLFLYPNTETHCCKMEVCFKCKAANHHDGDCNDFVEAENVLECRGCHVTLVKVDGCDSLSCLCGYSFSWNEEVQRQREQRRQLAPSDEREYEQWKLWHGNLASSFAKITRVVETQREVRLARMLRLHRSLLRRVLLSPVLRKRELKRPAVGPAIEPVSESVELLRPRNVTRRLTM